jgi:hypothetical protein
MPVSVIVLVFEVADDYPGFEQTVPVVAVKALLAGAFSGVGAPFPAGS